MTALYWLVGASLFKALLWRVYKSTDFDVHRNWLAITHSLPMSEWYYDSTSEWTLDYPPFFAYFEWLLSQIAQFIDPNMLKVQQEAFESSGCLFFQRVSVIVADTVLFASVLFFVRTTTMGRRRRGGGGGGGRKHATTTSTSTSSTSSGTTDEALDRQYRLHLALVLVFLNTGLMIVDHIHFQYNGFLMGIFIFSIAHIRAGNDLIGGILFAVLLNFKHIFLYVAPLYFIHLLRRYCMGVVVVVGTTTTTTTTAVIKERGGRGSFPLTSLYPPPPHRFRIDLSSYWSIDIGNLAVLGTGVVAVFAASFGPFLFCRGNGSIDLEQIFQIFRRMFPFEGRGLCHAYWAPNIWALYNTCDKAMEVVMKRIPPNLLGSYGQSMMMMMMKMKEGEASNTTKGLVEAFVHSVLPKVDPKHTVILTLLAMSPVLARTWTRPDPRNFAFSTGVCALVAFLFGWHVHEKAILLATLPLALSLIDVVVDDDDDDDDASYNCNNDDEKTKRSTPTKTRMDGATTTTTTRRRKELEIHAFWLLNIAGNASLLPLIHTPFEFPIKIGMLVAHTLVLQVMLEGMGAAWKKPKNKNKQQQQQGSSKYSLSFSLSWWELLYGLGLVGVQLFQSVIHPIFFAHLAFLPLLLWSTYCAFGIVTAAVLYYFCLL